MPAYCIADEDTVRGLRLAGVPGCAVSTADQAAEALARAVERPDCALLIVTEEVAAGLRKPLDALRAQRSRPLVVEIPGPGGPAAGGRDRDRLRHLVQRLVGAPPPRGPSP